MRYKFTFEKNVKEDVLKIFEAGEVDNNFVVMYEGSSGLKELQNASKAGAEQFIAKLRRKNFFPNTLVANKLYETTLDFFASKSEEKIVIEYADAETLVTEEEEKDVEVGDLLGGDEDTSEEDTSEDEIKEIDTEEDTPKFKPEDTSEHEN